MATLAVKSPDGPSAGGVVLTRNVRDADCQQIMPVIDQWWGGRHVADMLPKLFFVHFQNTSFVVEQNGQVIAFLIGFVSQTRPDEAYVHFVGVHPLHRKRGLAGGLYEAFYETVRKLGCKTVRCVTSVVNRQSIAFHRKIGFTIEPGGGLVDGVPVDPDYDGRGLARVLFVKQIA